jgi:predicted AAA+ superfamily ATPase
MAAMLRRHLITYARETLAVFPAVVIQGARQVGKSTFAQMLARGLPAEHFTFDDAATRDAVRADPDAFVAQFPGKSMVLDEVQRVPEIVLPIKAAIDRDRRPGRFILTGSTDLLKVPGTADSLAGRAATIHVHGLSQGEMAGRNDDFVTRILDGGTPGAFRTNWRRPDYVEMLARGAYPEVQRLEGRMRTAWLDGYLARIIERDAASVYRQVQPARLRAVLRLLAANQSGELVKGRLAEQSGIPATSISVYLDVAAAVFLVAALPPWTPNLTRREIGRHKSVVLDSAVAMRLARISAGQLEPLVGGDHLGPLLEGFVVSELMKQSGWSETSFDLLHFRDRNGAEVDLVVELDDGRILGIEVKAASSFKGEHFAGLRSLAERLGSRFAGGIVLGTGEAGHQHAERLWGLPISALWEL